MATRKNNDSSGKKASSKESLLGTFTDYCKNFRETAILEEPISLTKFLRKIDRLLDKFPSSDFVKGLRSLPYIRCTCRQYSVIVHTGKDT